MDVKRAGTAGFCMGVSLALHKLEMAIEANGSGGSALRRICTYGPIIHNPQVLASYEARGVVCLKSVDGARAGDTVLIRAHGVPMQAEATLRESGAEIIDATCPRVKKAQLAIANSTASGSSLLLFGDADHPEVRGLISYARGKSLVFASLEELTALESWVLASQTTQDASEFARIREYLEGRLPRLEVLATICDATGERQEEARSIASGVEAMVIVGGHQSGNTKRLAALSAECGIATYHVESASELRAVDFRNVRSVGLTAGASTPKNLIDEAEEWLKRLP